MAILLRLLACVTLMVCAEGTDFYSTDSHFNCLRRNHTCQNGGFCADNDVYEAGCVCSSNYDYPIYDRRQVYTGYDCSINITDIYDSDEYNIDDECPPCQNHLFCHKTPDNVTCHCSPDYFGKDCSKNRVKVECGSQFMTVMVRPIEPFEGKVYLGNDSNDWDCMLSDRRYRWGDRDYSFSGEQDYDEFDDDGNCNLVVANQKHGENVNKIYTRFLTIQYDPDIQMGLDLVINVTCIHHENGTWLTEASFIAERGIQPNGKEIVAKYYPVAIYFWHETDYGGETIKSIYLGQTIIMGNILLENERIRDIVVDSCTFTNSNGNERITVIEDGCPTRQGLPIDLNVNGYKSWHDGYSSSQGPTHSFRAFRFGSDPVLRVFCRVRLCTEFDDPACSQPDCDTRRKKREASDDNDDDDGEMTGSSKTRSRRSVSGDDGTISQTLTVLDPYDDSENAEAFQVTADKCMAEPVVKSVGISLIVTVAVLLLVSIGLAICVCRMTLTKREMGLRMKLKHLQDDYSKAGGLSNNGFDRGLGGGDGDGDGDPNPKGV